MEKNVAARRRAQQFTREGRWEQAAAELEQILQSGDVDPYDYVQHGDLLARFGRLSDGINSYEEAVSAYERVGLYRNAIAIAKKILRHDPQRPRTHWRLGDLYAKEGLNGDAVTHFFAFLDQSGGEATGEDFLDTLERVSDLSGQRVEVALRLADFYVRAGRPERAQRLLESVADTAATAGGFELATTLRDRAKTLNGQSALDRAGEPSAQADPELLEATGFDPFAMDRTPDFASRVDERPDPLPVEYATPPGFAGPAEHAAPPDPEETIVLDLPDSGGSWDAPASPGEGRTETPAGFAQDSGLEAGPLEPSAPAAGPCDPSIHVQLEADLLGESADPRREWIDEALQDGRPDQALALARAAHEENAEEIWPLEKLVAACTLLGDTLGTIRYLTLWGDLLINEEDLAGSLRCFQRVLALDPENATAQRRMARFRGMGLPGADVPPSQEGRPEDIPAAAKEATVAVRDRAEPETQDWFDLTTLLEEFRDGIRSQLHSADFAAHYDLGVSHFEMGLFEEAIEEFDAVLDGAEVPQDVAARAREMRGQSLIRLERYREAVHEFRTALELPSYGNGDRRELRYQLACALESAGELDESRSILEDLASAPDSTGREALARLGRKAS